MISEEKEFALSYEACDEVSDLIVEFCAKVETDDEDAIRYRLAAEDCMMHWLERGLEGHALTLRTGRRLMSSFFVLELEGPQEDPNAEEGEEEYGSFCGSLLVGLGLKPDYKYVDGCNCVMFQPKRKPVNQLVVLGVVVAVALATGSLGMLLPDAIREGILTGILQPVYDTFFDMLTCVAGPMIFLSVAWGVYGIGDLDTLGRIGKKLITRFLRIMFIVTCCATVTFPLLGPGFSGESDSGGQMFSILDMILGIVPANIIEPFATGNTLQIIFMAVVVAIALLYLGQRTEGVAEAIDQVNALVGFLMGIVSKLVPYVIFLVIVNIIWSGSMSSLVGMWKLLLVHLVTIVVITLVFFAHTCWRRKVRPSVLVKKLMATFMIVLTTASSVAAFSTNVDTCKNKFGIDESLVGFGLPLGMVTHLPMLATYYLIVVFFFAGEYGVACSPAWIVMAVIVSCVLSSASPPVPGGGAVVYTMLFAQMGIPAEALALALAVDVLTDFYSTACEQVCLLMTLVNTSADMGMIDEDVLRA